jgi:hypothetical protein
MLLADKNRGLGGRVGDVGGVGDLMNGRLEFMEPLVQGADGELVDRSVYEIDGPDWKWRARGLADLPTASVFSGRSKSGHSM